MSKRIPFSEIKRLAIPAIFAGIAEPIIGLVDIGVIGNTGEASDVDQGAVGLAVSFYAILLWSLAQIRTSISSIVSRYVGANDIKSIKTLIPQTIAFGALLGIVLGALAFIFSEDVFKGFYGLEEHQWKLLERTQVYFRIRIIGLPISLVVYIVFGVFRGYQNTVWIMKASLLGAFVNIVLDYVLVFGIGDFKPNLGMEGVAIASVVAQAVMLITVLYFLKKNTVFSILPSFKLNPQFKLMLKMSSNMLLRTLALNVAFFLANYYVADYGKDYVAAHTILYNLWVFSFFFIDGFSNAANALSGKLLGKNDFIGLKLLLKDVVRYNLIVAGILAGIFLLGYPFMGEIFSNKANVVNHFNEAFWLIIIAQFINSVTFTYDGVFKGLGETAYLRNTLFIASFLVFAPVVFSLDLLGLKMIAVWSAFLAWNFYRGASLVYKFKTKYSPLAK